MIRVIALLTVFALPLASYGQKPGTGRAGLGNTIPRYQIVDIGLLQSDTNSQGFGVSPGGVGVGRSIGSIAQAFWWTSGGGIIGLPNLAGRSFCVSNGANDGGSVVGACSTTLFGTSRLPVIWQNGVVTQLPMPSGQTLGDANDVNSSGVVVGSVDSGSLQKAVYYSGGNATYISQTTAGGSFFSTAFRINDSGRVVGQGIDPNNAARNVGIYYDIGSAQAFEVGALSGLNGALTFDVSNSGFITGSSMLNQGSGLPFRWSQTEGMVAVPLPSGTSQGSGRGVNSQGWVVGTASSAFAIPFVWDGTTTYRLADLLPSGSGWDLSTNTSSSAMGISDGNLIVGSGIFNGAVHAYAMIPVTDSGVQGRVTTSGGAGIRNVSVTISGGNLPAPKTVLTGSLGRFVLSGLQSGATYTVTVGSKRFTFSQPSQTVAPDGSFATVNFAADGER